MRHLYSLFCKFERPLSNFTKYKRFEAKFSKPNLPKPYLMQPNPTGDVSQKSK